MGGADVESQEARAALNELEEGPMHSSADALSYFAASKPAWAS